MTGYVLTIKALNHQV